MAELSGKSQLRRAANHSAIYAIGTVLRRITGFVMLPIYTRYLTPADYGIVELLTLAIEIVSILVGLRISQALFRYYILADGELEKRVIVSTVLFTVILASAVGVGALYFAAEPLSAAIFGNKEYADELRLFSFTLMINAIIATCLSYLRARQKPVLFVSINVVYLIIQVVLNVYFVVFLELHVLGVIYSALASGAIMGFFLLLYTINNVGVHYSGELAKKLIKFTAPLMVASLGALYVAYADKYFLRLFSGFTEVGLYALATRVSSVVYIVFEAFNMSWGVERFEVVKQENARNIYNQVFRYLSAVLFIVGCGVALFAQDFFWIMADPAFYGAGPIVPILTVAVILRIYTVFHNFGIILSERTRYIAEGSWVKAIIASIGYISLIPLLGIYGASIALLIANLVEFGWVYKRSKALYDMEIQWWQIRIMAIVTIIFVIAGIFIPVNEIQYFVMRIGLFMAMLVCIYKLPIWSSGEKEMVWVVIRRITGVGGKSRV